MKGKGAKRLRGPSVRRHRQFSGCWPAGFETDPFIADEGRACVSCQAPMNEQQVLHLARTEGVMWMRVMRCMVCGERAHTPVPATKSAELFRGIVRDEAA
jgi:hypothetical protein